jgi:1,4-dihydroxy-6-naphthoate synthase
MSRSDLSDRPVRLGISTCPNDTFAFDALLRRRVDWRGLEFDVELLDIQQLNAKLLAGELDVAKASFHAALLLADNYWVLPSGSALGFGVGPLLLSAKPGARPSSSDQLTLCPGEQTTATLLFKLFYPEATRLEQVIFSEIMPRLMSGTADFGVCIHEGRFTWQSGGLFLVEDLGTRWEDETGCPLPLGGILASKRLPSDVVSRVQATIKDSIEAALADPDQPLPTMRKYAQEFDDRVLMRHVELYVNDWTRDLGGQGSRALRELSTRAARAGVIPENIRLDIFADPPEVSAPPNP